MKKIAIVNLILLITILIFNNTIIKAQSFNQNSYSIREYKENIKLIEGFRVPQLNKTKKIWIYLPPDYDNTSKKYPVLYMNDGDQLFDENARRGGWKVDKTLNQLFEQGKTEGVIVVGIESAPNNKRSREYNVLAVKGLVKEPQGNKYLDFVVNNLKPYIDQNYRTLSTRENTAMVGSSFGGAISFAAGFKYPEVFSKIGALSSGLSPILFRDEVDFEKKLESKIYFDAGTEEGFWKENKADYRLLEKIGFSDEEVTLLIDKGGKHNNSYWRERFPAVFLWLFEDKIKFEKYISDVQVY